MTLIATAIALSIVPAGSQAAVCNQASGSQTGILVPTETSERPPVRHTANLGAVPGKGGGIATAAERSPALNGCALPTGGGGGGDILTGGDIAN